MTPASSVPTKIAERAMEFVQDGTAVGLGSGRAAGAFVRSLGAAVARGLHVRCVPTSAATAGLARQLHIPLTTLEEVMPLDVTIDGADEVDPQLNLIKGRGGALMREKIVAAASRRLVILVEAGKLVEILGNHKILPVEVVPFGLALCQERLRQLGMPSTVRTSGTQRFVTDNSNYVVDCAVSAIANPAELEHKILAIPGVVATGLFLGMADTVLIQEGDSVSVRHRRGP